MDRSPPASSVHGILQARILEWVVISFSGWSWTRGQTHVSCTGGQILYYWATREALLTWLLVYYKKIYKEPLDGRDAEGKVWIRHSASMLSVSTPTLSKSSCLPAWKLSKACPLGFYGGFSTLAWKIPWTEKSSRLQSMGSLRFGHDWATSLWLFTFMPWRREWQPTPVFLPRESQGRGSPVGCRLWGRTESDTTEAT